MAGLTRAAKLAVLACAVLAFAVPSLTGFQVGGVQGAPNAIGKQLSRLVTETHDPQVPALPRTESLALGPAGDPLTMAAARDPRIDRLLNTPAAQSADEWATIPGDVPWQGPGTFQVAEGRVEAPEPERRVRTVLIRVEDELPVDTEVFADVVMDVLNDSRGWRDIDNVSWARTDQPAEANLTLTLASPITTDALCVGVRTNSRVSCGRTSIVVINADRWAGASDAFLEAGGTIEEYRRYVINHEVGHFLSHPHVSCPAPGQLAPVMLQQTLRLQGCTPNGWPNP